MLNDIVVTGNKDTRSGFGDGIVEAARENDNIVALTADLAGSLKLNNFIKEFPGAFYPGGIAEANMIGIAAGLTIGGKIPYTTTFANFSTGRVYDQIRQSVAYSNKNVKICASHAGLTLGEDGATHQILEDIGLMKMLPGMTVIVPADYNQTKAATKAIANYEGPVYLRFGRPVWPIFTKEEDFVIGKAHRLSEGKDVSIFACGHMVWTAIEAGKSTGSKRHQCGGDQYAYHKATRYGSSYCIYSKNKCAVTAEEHNIIGGLGDSIAQVAARHCPIPIEYVGTNDTFGESGKPLIFW